ncbi:MAG: nucleotidyltransferase domain-containing protein [Gammaproteobacteria bacterium]|nr:nucleotidyltransferase domain-containing protein [Gammaproteobacteria bacterium]
MTDAILHLPPRYLQQVQTLLHTHLRNAEVWAYGSRVNGGHYEASDLDLVVRFSEGMVSKQRYQMLSDTREALSESNLPVFVQIVDWNAIPQSFHAEILARYVVVQTPG